MPFKKEPAFQHGQAERTAVLLCNLGTPDEPTAPALRRYLAEFLGDHRVVEIPRPIWWLILHGIILRTRPAKSARKYASIWTPEGSPLKVWTTKQATLLRGWSVEGQYGRLFDGVTNVSLHRKVAHFELGCIPEQAVELKAAVGLLISGLGRQHILSLPREKRKRILFEELARFLDTPGGEQIVAEGYAQLRKHNCWCASIIQQYSRFKASRVRGAVIGNAKQFFFMRQSDRADLADLAQDLPLPETAIDAIQRYPLPEQLPANQRHSSLCYFTPTTQPPQCGTVRHYQEAPCASAA